MTRMNMVQLLLLTPPIEKTAARRLHDKLRRGGGGVNIRLIGSYPASDGTLLSARQNEVLRGTAARATVKEMASRLSISQKTVETHRAGIMERLGTRRIPELVRYAIQSGVIFPGWMAKEHGSAHSW